MKFIVVCVFAILLPACISDYDLDYPISKTQVVVNGYVFADSAMQINLSWSNHPDSSTYRFIETANVSIDGDTTHRQLNYIKDGWYEHAHTYKAGGSYRLNVELANGQVLTSETAIPLSQDISCNFNTPTCDYYKSVGITIPQQTDEVRALYIIGFGQDKDGSWSQLDLYSDMALSDPFNKGYDIGNSGCALYVYDYFIRIPASNLSDSDYSFELFYYDVYRTITLYALSATKEFDLYFKGAFIQRSFDLQTHLPFSYSPIHLPTNINGGYGIFAGCCVSTFKFEYQ